MRGALRGSRPITPIDLLLQRIGRLHRHSGRGRPAPLRTPRLLLTGITASVSDDASSQPEFDGDSEGIYGRHILLRTLAVLRARDEIALPDDIAPLVEAAYGDATDIVPYAWLTHLAAAAEERDRQRADQKRRSESFALAPVGADSVSLIGWLNNVDVDPELSPPGRGTVRDSDGETLEVIVLERDPSGSLRTPSWLAEHGGRLIPVTEPPDAPLTRVILGADCDCPRACAEATRSIDTSRNWSARSSCPIGIAAIRSRASWCSCSTRTVAPA